MFDIFANDIFQQFDIDYLDIFFPELFNYLF